LIQTDTHFFAPFFFILIADNCFLALAFVIGFFVFVFLTLYPLLYFSIIGRVQRDGSVRISDAFSRFLDDFLNSSTGVSGGVGSGGAVQAFYPSRSRAVHLAFYRHQRGRAKTAQYVKGNTAQHKAAYQSGVGCKTFARYT
jgi:hypothetical protein